ncbi:MAG: Fic family protein [Rhizobiaceae bacterium]
MNKADFSDSPTGTLVPTISNQWAFVPNPLPPEIEYAAIAVPLAQAMQAIGELNAAGRSLSNPMLVIRPLQRREALLSSSMEGTYTTADALALAESDKAAKVDASTIEVRNYIDAFEAANEMRQTLPISSRMIREIHRILLADVPSERGANKRPGEFKDQQNFIGGRNRQIENARFVPPPPSQAEDAMAELERYLNREDIGIVPPIVDAALFHYQFETIHPFADGNGRVGRILIPIYLMEKGVLDSPLLYLSPAVEGHKDDYVDLMLGVSQHGEWTAWLLFFLEMVVKACKAANETLADLEALRQKFRQDVSDSGGSARYLTLIDELFVSPVVTIPDVARKLSVTYPAAKNAVDRLVEQSVLDEHHIISHPRRFISWPIVDLSEGRKPAPLPEIDLGELDL